MKQYNLGVDIGGTHIVCALVEPVKGKIVQGSIIESKVDAQAPADEIIAIWKDTIGKAVVDKCIQGAGVAMPGPFDYERGICKMEGVNKYDSLFGIDIKEEFKKCFPNDCIPIQFSNDASCFALGEYYAGSARKSERSLVVTLGTGFGSTFLIDGKIQEKEMPGVPPNGYLYCIPYKESIADDYFSTRWFVKEWEGLTGIHAEGVKEIAESATGNDSLGQSLFDRFADNLSEFILPWLEQFQPDVFVIGGSIAKASGLFLTRLTRNLTSNRISIPIRICECWEQAPIIGAAMSVHITQSTSSDSHNSWRRTEQFLAPEKARPTQPGHYDIYPAFPIGPGKIHSGIPAFVQQLIQYKTIIIDGYVGVFWDYLVDMLGKEFNKLGKEIRWFHVNVAMKPADEINSMLEPYLGGDDPLFGTMTDKHLIDWFDSDKLKKLKPDSRADINIIVGCGASLAGWAGTLVYIDLPKNELQFRMRAQKANNLGCDTLNDKNRIYKRFYFADWPALNEHKRNILSRMDWIVDGQRPNNLLFMKGDELRRGLTAMSRNFFRVRPWFEPGPWGGNRLIRHIAGLNKAVPNLAWSFELMVLENGLMFESNDFRLELSFDFLMFNNYKEVLGESAERFKYDFPIRFDFLDTFTGGNLSVQCHPRPEFIKENFGMPFTQDETYYIVDAKEDAHVFLGFKEAIDPDELRKTLIDSQENLREVDIEKFVQKHPSKKHDLFLIPNGTIHASGTGNLVLEISSAPYIFTFKMYDWLRLDLDGRPRPLNIERGMKNLYFDRQGEKIQTEFISHPCILEESAECVIEHLPTHPNHFYDVFRYSFDKEIRPETHNQFHVWMIVEGSSVIVETSGGIRQRFNYLETFVIPAAAGSYRIINEGKDRIKMVQSLLKSMID